MTPPLINIIGLFEYFQIPLVLVAAILAFRLPDAGAWLFAGLERRLDAIASRPAQALMLLAGLAIGARALALPLTGLPAPMVADETSAMLQAETYARGAWANPGTLTPDFEAVFVNLSPTYASMYPVFRAAPLALGLAAGLNAWFGVWATMVALILATWWMLRAWVSPRLALVGGLLVVVRFGLFSYWVNSYWGGAFTALGGVLLLGGYKRLAGRPTLSAGAAVGLGAMILMTSRPFEGLLFAAPFGVALLARFARAAPAARGPLLAAGLAAGLFVGAGAVVTVLDDRGVTGDWREAPYTLYRETTAETPPFLFEAPSRRAHARYYLTQASLNQEKAPFERGRSLLGWLGGLWTRVANAWNFYVGVALTLPFLIGAPRLGREPVALAAVGVLGLGLAAETWNFAHYDAPAFGVFVLAIVLGLERLRRWRPWARPVGLALGRWLPLVLALGLWLPLAYAAAGVGSGSFENDTASAACCAIRQDSIHQSVERLLDRSGDRGLIRVAGAPGAPITQIFMFNHADPGRARDIWVNADDALNRATIRRYPGRRIWRLDWLADGAACLRPQTTDLSTTPIAASDALPAGGLEGWTTGVARACPGGYAHPAWPNQIRAGDYMSR